MVLLLKTRPFFLYYCLMIKLSSTIQWPYHLMFRIKYLIETVFMLKISEPVRNKVELGGGTGRISIRNSESRNYPPFFCASRKERAILTQNPRKNRKNFRRMTSQSALEVPKVPFLNCSGIFDPDFKYKHLIHQNDCLGEL